MKIIDYGLWFLNILSKCFVKHPSLTENFDIYLDGFQIGCCRMNDTIFVWLATLKSAGFKIKSGTPGQISSSEMYWLFPPDYIITESDFEEIE